MILGAILISSKYEDVIPIKLYQVVRNAGHDRHSKQEILEVERDILRKLKFQIHNPNNTYEQAVILFKDTIYEQ